MHILSPFHCSVVYSVQRRSHPFCHLAHQLCTPLLSVDCLIKCPFSNVWAGSTEPLRVRLSGLGLATQTLTWWTIGMLMLPNFLTIYIYFSHTLAGVITTSFTLSYLLSNPLQPHPIVCMSLWIITKVLTLICRQFLWPYCH